jgi:6-phosphogluconolactonase
MYFECLSFLLCVLTSIAYSADGGSVFFVGTYSNTISAYTLSSTGAITYVNSTADDFIESPSWLVISKSNRFLYAVSEVDNFAGTYSGAISAYVINPDTLTLSFINKVSTYGAAPCHATTDVAETALYVSNYCSGTIAVVPLLPDGSLGNATQVIDHSPTGVPATDCDGAHVHEVVRVPHSDGMLSNDLGLDRMYENLLDANGALVEPPSGSPFVQLDSGSGPRHLVLHPSAPFIYLISELDNSVTTLAFDAAATQARFLSKLSTLPPPFSGEDMAAGEIQVSPDGRFVYCSNRDVSSPNLGRSSISVFAVAPEGAGLSYLQTISSFGIHPRHFVLYRDFVVVANRDSDNLVVLPRDRDSGLLREPISSTDIFTSPHLIRPVQVLITKL